MKVLLFLFGVLLGVSALSSCSTSTRFTFQADSLEMVNPNFNYSDTLNLHP